ncbi:hypothetical protein BC937DRAFT_93559 [Endogone sp. FLAS-F59071]|nr:hypothetical protein BC937DRAFT_93559 [Endogone sp. FLAS-F59071]|eukprot:RUS14614.1 hypothetical protein BC937DRAFT_93559 [Endogone sp. FLAS-F59071]
MPPSRRLTKAQEEASFSAAVNGGLKGAIAGLGLGLVATVAVRNAPTFRALKPAYKSIFAVGGTTAGLLFGADAARENFEKTQLGYMDESDIEEKRTHYHANGPSLKNRVFDYVVDNQWTIVGVSWVAAMAGSLAYTFSNRYLNTQQKVVQARMYAQAFTIAILLASAGISISQGDNKNEKVEESDIRLRTALGLPEHGPVPHVTVTPGMHKHN